MNLLNNIFKHKNSNIMYFDIIFIFIAYSISFLLFSDSINEINKEILFNIMVASIVYIGFFSLFNIYNNMTKYESGKDYLMYMIIIVVSTIISTIIGIFIMGKISFKINILSGILITMAIISFRVLIRIFLTHKNGIVFKGTKTSCELNSKNLLIIGAGCGARDIIKTIKATMRDEYNIVGIIDDDKSKQNYNISGVYILGGRNSILEISKKYNVDTIFFTINKIEGIDKKEILDICQKTNARIRILPSTEFAIKNKNIFEKLRDVEIEDLLYRESINLDNTNIANMIENNIILVTGGGGSIGSELCRQIVKYNPKKLIILDIYENSLYDLETELKSSYINTDIDAIIGSIRDKKRLEEIWGFYKPSIVFHAAAHKHVPLMENSPLEAIKNNVFGTYNVVNVSNKYEVKKFVLISSDKAVNPTNIMGATKRMCEMIVQAKDKVSKTEYVAVRFGNVLGSNGSVVPLFKKQIAVGGPVTVTHKEVTRYFMTIPEASQLVLQAATYASGGEIFVLDMGKPVKVYDLAVSLIKLSGFEPNIDIQIKITGLRPGEKLYEELLMAEEGLTTTNHNKIYIAKPIHMSMLELNKKLSLLDELLKNEKIDILNIKKIIKKVVPTYIYNSPSKNDLKSLKSDNIKIYNKKEKKHIYKVYEDLNAKNINEESEEVFV